MRQIKSTATVALQIRDEIRAGVRNETHPPHLQAQPGEFISLCKLESRDGEIQALVIARQEGSPGDDTKDFMHLLGQLFQNALQDCLMKFSSINKCKRIGE